MRYLTVALTKGRLANKTMEMFEKAGITCEEMKDKDSRKLIFTNEELKMKFFLAKGPDVPTYVEYGAADIGVVGKDTIKYPNIAKDYFFNRKHQTVDLIKLNGSIELAPIVGLSEVIVDIVETGSTLKENGLKVLEEVCPLSARMVVNQVSMKMENERIRKLIEDLRRVLQEEM